MSLAVILIMVIMSGLQAQTQPQKPLFIGERAPSFKAMTTLGEIDFPLQFEGKWVILFSHPGAFTPVCTSEFMAIQQKIDEFRKRNCELVGLSTDGLNSTYEWIKTIRDEIEFKGMKDVEIGFPIISDENKQVASLYQMIHPGVGMEKTIRSVHFIDPAGRIRAITYYPVSTGRNTAEMIRLLDALQTTDEFDVATPADWKPGEDVFIPLPIAGNKAERQYNKAWEGDNCPAWFMCMKSLPLKK